MERIWCVRCSHCYAEKMLFENQLGECGLRVEQKEASLLMVVCESNNQPIHPQNNPWMCETCRTSGADPHITKWDKEIDELI